MSSRSAFRTVERSTPSPAPLAASTPDKSYFTIDMPPFVYQTTTVDGRQDSSTLLPIEIKLSRPLASAYAAALRARFPATASVKRTKLVGVDDVAARESAVLAEHVYMAFRRFDGAEVVEYDRESGQLMGLRFPSGCFVYTLQDGHLCIKVGLHT